MVRLRQFLDKYLFFIVFPVVFLTIDMILSSVIPPYIIAGGRFCLNDYEMTRRDHPEEVWDKVFFGGSMVASAYREDVSESGYINLGLDCGVVTDLWEMVQRNVVTLSSELVVGLNEMTLYDRSDTDPGYPWHRKIYEPYSYFARDRLTVLLRETGGRLLAGDERGDGVYSDQVKSFYYGAVPQAALEEMIAASGYGRLPISDFQENMDALAKLADYCAGHGVRLRCVWMPVNPAAVSGDEGNAVRDRAAAVCQMKQVEFYNMENALDAECFYDNVHLNYEFGSYRFTEAVDPWLTS